MTYQERFSGQYAPLENKAFLDNHFETKTESSGEVVRLSREVMSAFQEFRTKNDAAIADLRRKQTTDVVLSEQVDRINKSISDLQADMHTEILALKRKDIFAFSGDDDGYKSPNLRAYQTKFVEYLRKGGLQTTQDLEVLAEQAPEIKALSTNVGSAGGFTVLPQVERTVTNLSLLTSPLRQVAAVQQIGTGSYVIPINQRGTTAHWVGEVDPRGQTQASDITELEFVPGELHAQPAATQQMLDDSYLNVEQWIASEIAAAFDQKEATAFFTGDGIKKPRGMLSYPIVADANWAWGKVGYIPTGVLGGFGSVSGGPPVANGADVLFDLTAALRQPYRPNARFAMSRFTLAEVRKLKDGMGNYLWQSGLQNGRPDTLLGFPVVEMEDMPGIASNSYSIAFGDFQQFYQIVDRIGIRTLRDPYTAKPFVLFDTTKRVGAGIKNFEAAKYLKFSVT